VAWENIDEVVPQMFVGRS